jgi:hypothetical protein
MKRVIIRNLDGMQTHGAELESPEAWIESCVAQSSWGRPEEYTIEVIDITAQIEQDRINREALEYLASTDWMVVRAVEGGKPMSEDVKRARAEARARIVR